MSTVSKQLVALRSSASDNLQLNNVKKARKYAIFRDFSIFLTKLVICIFKMTLKSVAVEKISGLYAAVYLGGFSVSLTILRRPLP